MSSSEASASGSQSTGVTSGAESSTAAEPSTGDEPPTLLCTDGPPPTWCFERRELDILSLPLDLDGDGLDDLLGLQEVFTAHRNVGDAEFEALWSVVPPYEFYFVELASKTPTKSARIYVGSENEPNTAFLSYTADTTSMTLELEVPLQHNWQLGGYLFFDVSGDGLEDVVIPAGDAARLLVLLGQPDGGYEVQPELVLDDAVSAQVGHTIGDVDGDGNVDVLMPRSGELSPSVYFGDGAGGFAQILDVPAYGRWPAYAIDFEGDGDDDILTPDVLGFTVAYSEPGRSFRVVEQGRGQGPENFEEFMFIPADLDGDGIVEIVGFQDDIVSADGPQAHYEARLHVYSDLGEEGFATDRSLMFEDTCDDAREVFVPSPRPVQLDGDGQPDFLFQWTTACPEPLTIVTLALLYRPQ